MDGDLILLEEPADDFELGTYSAEIKLMYPQVAIEERMLRRGISLGEVLINEESVIDDLDSEEESFNDEEE